MATQIARSTEPFFKEFVGPRVKVRVPLRKESEKRQSEKVIYSEKRKAYLETHPFCEWPDGCARLASDLHHKARRGANYLDESTFMGLCRFHHQFCHQNPADAKAMGLLQ